MKYIGLSGHSPKLKKAKTPLSLIPILLNLKEEEEGGEGGGYNSPLTHPHSAPVEDL